MVTLKPGSTKNVKSFRIVQLESNSRHSDSDKHFHFVLRTVYLIFTFLENQAVVEKVPSRITILILIIA